MSIRRINALQTKLYWRAWGACRKALIRDCGMSSKEAGEYRAMMHTKALGFAKSSKDLDNADLDKVLAVFRARSEPTNTAAQISQQEQPLKRHRKALQNLVDELDYETSYIETMAQKICKKPLERCYEQDLAKLIAALTLHLNRQPKPATVTDGDPF